MKNYDGIKCFGNDWVEDNIDIKKGDQNRVFLFLKIFFNLYMYMYKVNVDILLII